MYFRHVSSTNEGGIRHFCFARRANHNVIVTSQLTTSLQHNTSHDKRITAVVDIRKGMVIAIPN